MPWPMAEPTPSLNGFPSAAFCHACSCPLCKVSSRPSVTVPPVTRPATAFAPPLPTTSRMPVVSMVSISPKPSFCESPPLARLTAPVPIPDSMAAPVCSGVTSPVGDSCLICSCAPPAPTRPSPAALAKSPGTFPATIRPRPITPPAAMEGVDSINEWPMVLGFCTMAPALPKKPSASSTLRFASCCAGEYLALICFLASSGVNPVSDSKPLDTTPPRLPGTTMSARPTREFCRPSMPL